MNPLLNNPIPGMSLTVEPGSRPWENPPQFAKLSEVVDYYTEKLDDPEIIDSILESLKEDIDIVTLVEGILKVEVMRGIHTVHMSTIVLPIVVEIIKTFADLTGTSYILGPKERKQLTTVDPLIVKQAMSEIKKQAKEMATTAKEEEPIGGLMKKRK